MLPIAIVGIVFGTGVVMLKMLLEHKKAGYMLGDAAGEGSSLKVSELELMITSAVDEAVEPLISRIDDLESERLLATSEKMLLEESSVARVTRRTAESAESTKS